MTKTVVSAGTDQERDSHRQQDEHRSEPHRGQFSHVLQRGLQRTLRRFVRPSPEILDPRQRLQAELVSAVLLAIGIWGLVVSVPYTWLLEPSVRSDHLLGVLGALVVVALCFTVSRTRWYQVSGAVGFLVVGWLAIRGGELGDFQSSLIVVVDLLVLAALAGRPPRADFEVPGRIYGGTTVTLTDGSSGDPTGWKWDFEDDGVWDASTQDGAWEVPTFSSYPRSVTVKHRSCITHGCDVVRRTVSIRDPRPSIVGVTTITSCDTP